MGFSITNNGGPGGSSSASALGGSSAAAGTRNGGNVNGVPVDEILASLLNGQGGDSPLTPPQEEALARAGWKAMDDIALDTSFYTVTALVLESLQKAKEAENQFRSERSRAAVADERAAEKEQRKAADDKRLSGYVAAGAEAAQGATGMVSGGVAAYGGYRSAMASRAEHQYNAKAESLTDQPRMGGEMNRAKQELHKANQVVAAREKDVVARERLQEQVAEGEIYERPGQQGRARFDEMREAHAADHDLAERLPSDPEGPLLEREQLAEARATRAQKQAVMERENQYKAAKDAAAECGVMGQEGRTLQDASTAFGRGFDSLFSAISKGFTSQIDHEQELAQLEATSLRTSADEKREESRKSESTMDGLKQAWESTRGTVEAVMRSNAETNRILIS